MTEKERERVKERKCCVRERDSVKVVHNPDQCLKLREKVS